MSKSKIIFQCQSCGYISVRWLGKCPDCNEWNTFVQEKEDMKSLKYQKFEDTLSIPQPLNEIKNTSEERFNLGIGELDRILGGGLVSGSMILIGGPPGIGKSTLILQAGYKISEQRSPVLYVSGEESPEQIKLRSERLSISSNKIMILSETVIENIISIAKDIKPSALIIDSIQTVYTEEMPSAPGSVGQIREASAKLMFFTKKYKIPLFLVGHVTKDGSIAGPRVLEHIVDTVLYFEGDKSSAYRILRTVKNRFGSTNEIGIFEMTSNGLKEITNPSELFLSEKPVQSAGSAIVSSIEGTRPLLIELQALVTPTTFGIPRRTSMGVDFNRVNLLVAVLEKKMGINLGGMDIFINVVGGIRIIEPSSDIGVIAAIVSSFWERIIDSKTCFFGEIGLSGEVRAASQADIRIKEASNIGFNRIIIPKINADKLKDKFNVKIIGVTTINEVIEYIRG